MLKVNTHCNHLWITVILELQVIHWSHFILSVLNFTWICEEERGSQLFVLVGACAFGGVRLTGKGAPEDLQPHAKRSVPALRDDSDVTSHHRLSQPVHHRSVLVIVSKKQLRKKWRLDVSGWGKEVEDNVKMNSPSQHIHHGWCSILCCHCWKPGSRMSHSHFWNKTTWGHPVDFRIWNRRVLIIHVIISHSLRESRPWVMIPVNSVSLRASISNQWIMSSEFAHQAPPLMLSSSSDPWGATDIRMYAAESFDPFISWAWNQNMQQKTLNAIQDSLGRSRRSVFQTFPIQHSADLFTMCLKRFSDQWVSQVCQCR